MNRALRSSCLALLASCALATDAGAQILEIPLPKLVGIYPAPRTGERTTTVVLPEIPKSFVSVSIRVRGTTEIGVLTCPEVVDWPTRCVATFGPFSGSRMVAVHYNLTRGAFEWTATFESVPHGGTTWDFLMDGQELLHFEAGPSAYILPCAPASSRPAVTVAEAVLVVAGEFEIPEPNSTWGRVKAGYR